MEKNEEEKWTPFKTIAVADRDPYKRNKIITEIYNKIPQNKTVTILSVAFD